MSDYYKTAKGHSELENRHLTLNVRQRRLLLLIGTDDFSKLNEQFKHKIASPDLLLQLEEMGLIDRHQSKQNMTIAVNSLAHSEIKTNRLNNQNAPIPHDLIQETSTDSDTRHSEQTTEPDVSSFQSLEKTLLTNFSLMNVEEIKSLMAETLSQYRGGSGNLNNTYK